MEFLAALISIWVDVLTADIIAESYILSQEDNTSATGWLKKSNFADYEGEIVQLTMAHQLASLIINAESCLFSQWFPGAQNEISDACSRDFHLNGTELTQLILTFVLNQVPFGVKVCQLPNKIISWLTCLLWNPSQKEQWNQQTIPSKLSLGKDSSNISNQLPSTTIHSLTNSLDTDPRLDKDGKSSLFLHRQSR